MKGDRLRLLAVLPAIALVAFAVWRLLDTSGPAGTGPATASSPGPSAAPKTRLEPGHRPAAGPALARVSIPRIGVDAPIIRLGLNRDRTLQVPADSRRTGWWSGGAKPGRPGPTVIVGHVDSRSGPAVFYRLRELRRGDEVLVRWRSRRAVRFVVSGREQVKKDSFPTRRVYGDRRAPVLRLVTCGGPFNQASGHYRDNLVVYGRPA